jgi:hypothetical protein
VSIRNLTNKAETTKKTIWLSQKDGAICLPKKSPEIPSNFFCTNKSQLEIIIEINDARVKLKNSVVIDTVLF